MISIETINQLKFTRIYTLGRLRQTVDTEWDTQPKGYNNTIRWNAGHIFVTMETLMQRAIAEYEPVHPEWHSAFCTRNEPGKMGNRATFDRRVVRSIKSAA